MKSSGLVAALAVLLLLGTPCYGRAEPRETSAYTEAVNLGIAEFDEKNFLEARAHFARAHALYPNARTLRALGMLEFELKHYTDSVHFLTLALDATEKPLDSDQRQQTRKLLERANGYIARITLDLELGTRVSVDGSETGLGSGEEMALPVGDHLLEFRAQGRIANKRTLSVRGGEQSTLRVRLAVLNVPASNPAPTTADASPGRPVYKNPWLWTVLGVVVVGAVAGTAIGLTLRDSGTTTGPIYTGTSGARPLLGPAL